jgi:hypothetical protein
VSANVGLGELAKLTKLPRKRVLKLLREHRVPVAHFSRGRASVGREAIEPVLGAIWAEAQKAAAAREAKAKQQRDADGYEPREDGTEGLCDV